MPVELNGLIGKQYHNLEHYFYTNLFPNFQCEAFTVLNTLSSLVTVRKQRPWIIDLKCLLLIISHPSDQEKITLFTAYEKLSLLTF